MFDFWKRHEIRKSRPTSAYDFVRRARLCGLTLIEVVVVIGIIGILVSLLLSAVQFSRESARVFQCSSNLRQMTIASLAQSDQMRHLPTSRIQYDAYGQVEKEILWGRVHGGEQVGPALLGPAETRDSQIARVPNVLRCPSALPVEQLTNLSIRFGDKTVLNRTSETSDYRGNGGVSDSVLDDFDGVYSVFRNQSPAPTQANVADGMSNTLFAWETVGACYLYLHKADGKITKMPWGTIPQVMFDEPPPRRLVTFPGTNLAGYNYGWDGFGTGRVFVQRLPDQFSETWDVRYLHSTEAGSPFSMHPTGLVISYGDGHTQTIPRTIALPVLIKLAGRDNGQWQRGD